MKTLLAILLVALSFHVNAELSEKGKANYNKAVCKDYAESVVYFIQTREFISKEEAVEAYTGKSAIKSKDGNDAQSTEIIKPIIEKIYDDYLDLADAKAEMMRHCLSVLNK